MNSYFIAMGDADEGMLNSLELPDTESKAVAEG